MAIRFGVATTNVSDIHRLQLISGSTRDKESFPGQAEISREVVYDEKWQEAVATFLTKYDTFARCVLQFYIARRFPEYHSEELVDLLHEDFRVKLIRGAFRAYKPAKGPLRTYLKHVLRNSVYGYFKNQHAYSHMQLDLDTANALEDKSFDPSLEDCFVIATVLNAIERIQVESPRYACIVAESMQAYYSSTNAWNDPINEEYWRRLRLAAAGKSSDKSSDKSDDRVQIVLKAAYTRFVRAYLDLLLEQHGRLTFTEAIEVLKSIGLFQMPGVQEYVYERYRKPISPNRVMFE